MSSRRSQMKPGKRDARSRKIKTKTNKQTGCGTKGEGKMYTSCSGGGQEKKKNYVSVQREGR